VLDLSADRCGVGGRVFDEAGQSLVIIFDVEVVTEGSPHGIKARSQIRSIILAHMPSGSRFAGCLLVCELFLKLSL